MKNDYSDIRKQIDKQLDKYNNVQSLMKYINVNSLYKMHIEQAKNKATGVDKITKEEYEVNIGIKLKELINNMKNNKYYPKLVRRVMIPKPNGKERPLGIPSYVKIDIKGFFEYVDPDILIRMLEVVIKDKDFIYLIRKFLKAGYMYNGEFNQTKEGTAQSGSGIISPILANLYLHVALDNWFDNEIKELCKSEAYIVRYADDFVCMFQYENDAKMFYDMLIKRFAQFKLEVEETKTKIFPFGRYAKEQHNFDFLGFTIANGKTRNGYYKLSFTTSKKKSKAKYKTLQDFVKINKTTKPKDLIKQLNKKLIGLYNYFGISGNYLWLIRIYNIKHNPLIKPKISFNLW